MVTTGSFYVPPEIQCTALILFPLIIYAYNLSYTSPLELLSPIGIFFQQSFLGLYSYLVCTNVIDCITDKYNVNLTRKQTIIITIPLITYNIIIFTSETICTCMIFMSVLIYTGLVISIRNIYCNEGNTYKIQKMNNYNSELLMVDEDENSSDEL